MPRSLVGCVPAIAMLMIACGGGGAAPPAVASVSLTASRTGPLTSLGDTVQLAAVALDAKGVAIAGVGVALTSGNPAVATVTQGGLVTAIANGTTTIHASAGTKEATLDVAVTQVAAKVLVTPSSIRVPPGETPLFHATGIDARDNAVAGAPAPVWTTNNPAIASIGADGRAAVSSSAANGSMVSAVATIGSLSSSAGGQMTIDSAAVYVETIVVTASGSTSLSSLSQTLQLAATASNPRLGDVTSQVSFAWSTNSSAVASASTSGLVTALGNGSATISATSNGVNGILIVKVAQIVATVTVATANGAPAPTLPSLGEMLQLAAAAFDAGGSRVAGASFAWSSDAPVVATVDGGGLVTAKGNGTAHLVGKATSNQVANPSPGFSVVVQQAVAAVSVAPVSATIPRCSTAPSTRRLRRTFAAIS